MVPFASFSEFVEEELALHLERAVLDVPARLVGSKGTGGRGGRRRQGLSQVRKRHELMTDEVSPKGGGGRMFHGTACGAGLGCTS